MTHTPRWMILALGLLALAAAPVCGDDGPPTTPTGRAYAIVDTAQHHCYDDNSAIDYPEPGEKYFGQDAQYRANAAAYEDHGDGTVSDLVTGLMWTKDPGEKMTAAEAVSNASGCRAGGYEDWRLPSIKELYSLIRFDGHDPDPRSEDTSGLKPFIDASVFGFSYGDPANGERVLDSQFATSTIYTSTTMNGNKTMFGVNFADGRIKGYPAERAGPRVKTYYVLYVRGNTAYGRNEFEDNGDGTITDHATGLVWTKADSGTGMNWQAALQHAESLEFAGHDDWRLPNAKELQSIVDYTRSPDATDSAAIDPIFEATVIRDEAGQKDFGWYWTSTTHIRGQGGRAAVYVTFGRAGGFMGRRGRGPKRLLDVHGAGAQRSDPKAGDASRFPEGRGPQGDVIRIENLVRCVRGGNVRRVETGLSIDPAAKPNIILILADDMGWTGLSVGMDEDLEDSASDFYRTPRIDTLAAQGMRFSRAYSPGALCTPTRASILTGKTPARVHITTPGRGGRSEAWHKLVGPQQLREFPSSETTVAECLKKAGYATAHFGKWHLPSSEPGEHGFDVHDGETGNDGPGISEDPNPKDIFGITERAVAFIESQSGAGMPFYVQLSHYAVHSPTLALAASKARFEKLPPGQRHSDVDYAAMTYDLDTGVGMLLDRLDELGLTATTYVVFMSDNGAPGGRRRPSENLPLRGGKGMFYEGGIRVPMVVRGPGIEPDSHCTENVIGYDLLPTFCAWAGIAAPDGIDGTNLEPVLQGRPDALQRAQPALLFHYPHYGQGPQVPQSAIILGDHKLIQTHSSGALQLFDLASDPSEKDDLSTSEPKLLAMLELVLQRQLEEAGAQMPVSNPDYDPDATPSRARRPGRTRGGGR